MPREEVRQKVETIWKQLIEQLNQPKSTSINEEQTKVFFIMPLLGALGWFDNMSDVEPEFQIPKFNDRVDYALMSDGKPVLFVEAKRLGEKLDDKHRKQLIERGPLTDVAFGVLTNGIDLEVHDLTYKGPIGGSLLFAIALNISEGTFPTQFDKLWLLSKESWVNGELVNYAKLSAALKEIRDALKNPQSYLQQAVRKIMKKPLGRKASIEEVQTALKQALSQLEAVEPVAKTTQLTLPSEWDEEELQKYFSHCKEKYPLEYAYYAVLSKQGGTISLLELSKILTARLGKSVDGKNIRGMLGGITIRFERKMKKERLDVREPDSFSIRACPINPLDEAGWCSRLVGTLGEGEKA